MVECPICSQPVKEIHINYHIDSGCADYIHGPTSPPQTQGVVDTKPKSNHVAHFFTPGPKKTTSLRDDSAPSSQQASPSIGEQNPHDGQDDVPKNHVTSTTGTSIGQKRNFDHTQSSSTQPPRDAPSVRRSKNSHAPLAERMRPQSLEQVAGQELVGPNGVLRNLILTDRVPSMILWGGPGTGKTTIARLIAQTAGTRFVEINSTSSGVAECKRLFAEANNERNLTGRKTIIFCDEIHRFSKTQQDVFLGPVEAGHVTLIGATTENPSFKVVNALLSRCRTFTLSKLSDEDVFGILKRSFESEVTRFSVSLDEQNQADSTSAYSSTSWRLLMEDEYGLLHYLAAFADGDARTGLNLLELAFDLCRKPDISIEDIKGSLTKTLVYDRAGDQHYDTISAFHKSVRGSDADAALYYLARMLQSGEDPLYIARRMVVIASEDVGLADNTMLSLATATYTAAEKIGMPECRINLAHCAVALCMAPKSVRAYRGLNAAYAALAAPGVASLPIPYHIRNAPTRLMKDLGYGKEYKYNPDFVDGRVVQGYLPDALIGKTFLAGNDLGDKTDPELNRLTSETYTTDHNEQEEINHYYDDNGDLLLNPDGD